VLLLVLQLVLRLMLRLVLLLVLPLIPFLNFLLYFNSVQCLRCMLNIAAPFVKSAQVR
jgi:hypothetical protein